MCRTSRVPPAGYGLTLLLHSFGGNYNQFSTSRNQSQFGERGAGSLVVTPGGRGPDGFYLDHAGAEVFEVWADVARNYKVDPAWTAIGGYSMGGYGAYKLAVQFPDLFARVHTTVGPPGIASIDTRPLLASLRNLPILIWAAGADELVPIAGPREVATRLSDLGYRYEFEEYLAASHLLLAFNDQYQPAADFLGEARVERDPPHVSYAYNPRMDFPAVGTAAGHAYWVSGVRLRDPAANGGVGVVDVRSEGFGSADAPPSGTSTGFGQLERRSARHPVLLHAHADLGRRAGGAGRRPPGDRRAQRRGRSRSTRAARTSAVARRWSSRATGRCR